MTAPAITLERHLAEVRAEGCTCPHKILPLGILYGISFGKGWVRLYDVKGCPHHDALRPGHDQTSTHAPCALGN